MYKKGDSVSSLSQSASSTVTCFIVVHKEAVIPVPFFLKT